MNERIKQLKEDLQLMKDKLTELTKEETFISSQKKALIKQIKAQEELIQSITVKS